MVIPAAMERQKLQIVMIFFKKPIDGMTREPVDLQ
jgi:hypothetical protein